MIIRTTDGVHAIYSSLFHLGKFNLGLWRDELRSLPTLTHFADGNGVHILLNL